MHYLSFFMFLYLSSLKAFHLYPYLIALSLGNHNKLGCDGILATITLFLSIYIVMLNAPGVHYIQYIPFSKYVQQGPMVLFTLLFLWQWVLQREALC